MNHRGVSFRLLAAVSVLVGPSSGCPGPAGDAATDSTSPGTDAAEGSDSGDAGGGGTDASSADSGGGGTDAGTMGTDAGSIGTDAGPTGTDSGPMATDSGPMLMPGVDTDGDMLDDVWEAAAGDASYLDWMDSDTDGDAIPDGSEDPDGDGLTNLEELATTRLATSPMSAGPHPLQYSVLVELDTMMGRNPADAILGNVVAAYADAMVTSPAGVSGVGIHIYRDEAGIPAFNFDGSFPQRWTYFATHPPMFSDMGSPPIPYDKMVHVMVVTQRNDDPFRGGEVVTNTGAIVEESGVLIYYDALDALNPQCGVPALGLPDITLAEAIAGTITHEVGHALQLGHDTGVGGGVNYWNVMSIPMTCGQAQARFHGDMNTNATLGATMAIGASRFSLDAAVLMSFTNKLSVETSELVGGGDGVEM